jgi:hypothetical protein
MVYHVYILHSVKLNKYYLGFTSNDLEDMAPVRPGHPGGFSGLKYKPEGSDIIARGEALCKITEYTKARCGGL